MRDDADNQPDAEWGYNSDDGDGEEDDWSHSPSETRQPEDINEWAYQIGESVEDRIKRSWRKKWRPRTIQTGKRTGKLSLVGVLVFGVIWKANISLQELVMSTLTYVGPMSRWETVIWVAGMTTIAVSVIMIGWAGLMWGMCRHLFEDIRDKRPMWELFKRHPVKLPVGMVGGFVLSSLVTLLTGSFAISLLTGSYGVFGAIYMFAVVVVMSYVLVGLIGRIYLDLYDNDPDYLID